MPGLKERAKTLVELIDGAAFHSRRPADRRSTTRPPPLLTPEARGAARRARGRARGRRAVERRRDRAGGARIRRAQGRQARRGGAAAARGADRPHHLARIFDVLAVLGKRESLARWPTRRLRHRRRSHRRPVKTARALQLRAPLAPAPAAQRPSCSAHWDGLPNRRASPAGSPKHRHWLSDRSSGVRSPPGDTTEGIDHGREDRRQHQDPAN